MPTNPETIRKIFNDMSSRDDLWLRALSLPDKYGSRPIRWDSDPEGTQQFFRFKPDSDPKEGGHSVVFKMQNASLDAVGANQDYAMKVLILDLDSEPAVREKWITECKALLKLNDCHSVPRIYATGIIDGLPAIVMDWVEGQTLQDRLLDNDWKPADMSTFRTNERTSEAKEITRHLCAAMDDIQLHYSGENIVHGDIKPANIIIKNNKERSLILLDYGEASLGIRNATVGYTPLYASPEQIALMAQGGPSNKSISSQSDQYCIGVILLEMCDIIQMSGGLEKRVHFLPIQSKTSQLREIAKHMTMRSPEDRYGNWDKIIQEIALIDLRRFKPHLMVPYAVFLFMGILIALMTSMLTDKIPLIQTSKKNPIPIPDVSTPPQSTHYDVKFTGKIKDMPKNIDWEKLEYYATVKVTGHEPVESEKVRMVGNKVELIIKNFEWQSNQLLVFSFKCIKPGLLYGKNSSDIWQTSDKQNDILAVLNSKKISSNQWEGTITDSNIDWVWDNILTRH